MDLKEGKREDLEVVHEEKKSKRIRMDQRERVNMTEKESG